MIKNEEGYMDPTHQAKAIFKEAGFEVIERIVLKNIRTGRVYR